MSGQSGVAVLVGPDGARTPLVRDRTAPAPTSPDTVSGQADTPPPDTVRALSGTPGRRDQVHAAIDAAYELADTPDDTCDHACTCQHKKIAHSVLTGYCTGCRARCAHNDGHHPGDCPQWVDELRTRHPELVRSADNPQVAAALETDDAPDVTGWLRTLPADQDQHPAVDAWGSAWDRAEAGRAQLAGVVDVLAADGHPVDQLTDIGRAVAERIAHHRGRAATLAATLDEVLRAFTHDTHPGEQCKQSGHVRLPTIERWRALLARTGEGAGGGTAYQRVQGRCPSCGKEKLFLADDGFVTCSQDVCRTPDAATSLLFSGARRP